MLNGLPVGTMVQGRTSGRYRHGFRYAHLPKISFVESTDDYGFTFLDPVQVIRGLHLIPVFSEGRTSLLLPTCYALAGARARRWQVEFWVRLGDTRSSWFNGGWSPYSASTCRARLSRCASKCGLCKGLSRR